ncbi:MAG: DUF2382 domain-containing protein [Verrucomicrobia bacterium]|nr:DUF2382 domain-containing protein [Verrucomicrobiota bacterium]MBV8276332.1 DUF2382 domain-containing protein [Verrucomicrobiota bacterium]
MAATSHSIDVNAPLRAVYNQWTQFEEFPRFMEGVEQVRQEGPKRLFWKTKIGGMVKEWEAEVTQQEPDQRIAWASVDGSPNSGTVTFESISPEWTKVSATIEYEPEGLLEKTGDALGIPSGRVQADLERFRGFIESRGQETGGWRGEIKGDDAARPNSAVHGGEGIREENEAQEGQRRTGTQGEEVRAGQHSGESSLEVPLSEEEVNLGKRTVPAGEVKIHKKTSTEQVNVPVELKKEDAVVERLPADEMETGEKEAFREEHLEVPLTREEPVIEKKTHVTGGVRVRKTEGTEQRTVQETIRREDVDIDDSGKSSSSR